MTSSPIAVLDEAAIRRIVAEELARQLDPILAAVRKAMLPAAQSDEPLSRKDLAALLGVGARTLRRMLLGGFLPEPIRASQRAMWWPRDVIKNWMDSGGLIQARAGLRMRKGRGSV
jgi:predicted DNA-binding transcriptional regulator AlpA